MAKYDFYLEGDNLRVDRVVTDNDFQPKSMVYTKPDVKEGANSIKLSEAGIHKQTFLFEHFGTIAGEIPINLSDAMTKLTNLIQGFDVVADIYDAHYARVISDGGIIESETVTKNVIRFLVNNYGINTLENFETDIPIALDPCVWGYKMGTGALSTIGFACQKLYSLNPSADAVQATAGSQPLILTHNDIDGNYAFFPRTTSTINQSIRTSTGGVTFTPATDTLVVTAKIFMPNQTANSYDSIAFDGTRWRFEVRNRGVNVLIRFGGSTSSADSSEYTPSATEPHWVRVKATPTEVIYEWSADGAIWTTLNSGVTIPSYGSASNVFIGYSNSRTQNATKIYHVFVENTTTGISKECNMNDFDPAVSETTFTTNGTVWTIDVGTNTTGLKMQMVDRTLLQGDGIAHKLVSSIAINQPHTAYAIIKRGGLGTLSGMAVSSSISNNGTNTTLNNGTALNIANSSTAKQFLTIESNGANSKLRVNAGADTVGNAGANNGTYLELFANGASYGNYVLGMYLISQGSDTDVQKSAMYNYFFA